MVFRCIFFWDSSAVFWLGFYENSNENKSSPIYYYPSDSSNLNYTNVIELFFSIMDSAVLT